MTIEAIIDEILDVREGWPKYTNHPADRGGPTKGGVTLEAWREYSGRPLATVADLKAITRGQAVAFYRARYITNPGFDRLPADRLQEFLIDYAVHSWIVRPVRALQEAIKAVAGGVIAVDGKLGPQTRGRLAALSAADVDRVYYHVVNERAEFLETLVFNDRAVKAFLKKNKTTQLHNLRGWSRRVRGFM